MIITHNMGALNAQRQFKINTNTKAKTAEKLSSGYKINRASDDAAGLSISEKMRRQIRGLTQGVENTEAGVSLCQVADGALAEVNDMLHRITELSVKSANGTNSYSDRQAIQDEINQILDEIDRISETTTFNGRKLFADDNNEIYNSVIGGIGNTGGVADSTQSDNYIYGVKSLLMENRNDNTNIPDGLYYHYWKDNPVLDRETNILHADEEGVWLNDDKSQLVTWENMGLDKLNPVKGNYSFDLGYVSYSFTIEDSADFNKIISDLNDTEIEGITRYVSSNAAGSHNVGTIVNGVSVDYNVSISLNLPLTTFSYPDLQEMYSNSLDLDTTSDLLYFKWIKDADGRLGLMFNGIKEGNQVSRPNDCPSDIITDGSIVFWATDEAQAYIENFNYSQSANDIWSNLIEFKYNESTIVGCINCKGNSSREYLDKALDIGNVNSQTGWNIWLEADKDSKVHSVIGVDKKTITYKPDEKTDDGSDDTNDTPVDEVIDDIKVSTGQLWIQSGCDTGDGILLEIDKMNTTILGINDLNVTSIEGAEHAMTAVEGALEKLSANRSKIGAQQNRLEHTIANEDNIIENTTAAESRIRDADMAEEMVKFSKENILEQVGQSMMAQANQSTQGVLSLLQ